MEKLFILSSNLDSIKTIKESEHKAMAVLKVKTL